MSRPSRQGVASDGFVAEDLAREAVHVIQVLGGEFSHTCDHETRVTVVNAPAAA